MRTLGVILIAAGVMAFSTGNTPTKIQMRHAFENHLADLVAQTMELIQASGGPSAVEKVKDGGNDAFEIRNFQKIECKELRGETAYECTFSTDIILANGIMRNAFAGRFYNTLTGFKFTFIEAPPTGLQQQHFQLPELLTACSETANDDSGLSEPERFKHCRS